MSDFSGLGRLLIIAGGAIVVVGVVILLLGRLPGLGSLGRLPGDIIVRREGFTFYAPITTMLLISIILSLIANLIFRR